MVSLVSVGRYPLELLGRSRFAVLETGNGPTLSVGSQNLCSIPPALSLATETRGGGDLDETLRTRSD